MIPARTSTNTTAMAMPVAVSIFLEVPRKGQFPRYWISRMLLISTQLNRRTARSPNMAVSYFFPRMFMSPSISPRQMKAPGASTRNRNGSNAGPNRVIGVS